MLNAPSVSSTSCIDLGWKFRSDLLPAVCGESDNINGCFSREHVPFPDAVALCSAAGGRLCTLGELEAGATRGTGCNLDVKHVWTRSSCGSAGNSAWAAHGRDGFDPRCLSGEATAPDGGAAVRCCADTVVAAFAASRPETAQPQAQTDLRSDNSSWSAGSLGVILGVVLVSAAAVAAVVLAVRVRSHRQTQHTLTTDAFQIVVGDMWDPAV